MAIEQSLVDQYCGAAHEAPLTAADYDQTSGAMVTADATGVVAVTRQGETFPGLIFLPAGPIKGAAAISPGGSLVAIGDQNGVIAAFNTWEGTCVFEDYPEEGARPRPIKSLAFNRDNVLLASLAGDGVVRVFDISRWEIVGKWNGFSGESIAFNEAGDKILAIDTLGQTKLLDIVSYEMIDLEMVPGGVRVARFTPDDRYVVTMGQGSISLIALPEGRIIQSFTARGNSGMLNIVVSPEGDRVAAITNRSVHIFSLPDLQPLASDHHGAEEPTSAAVWDWKGVGCGGTDGLMHRPGSKPSLPPVLCVGGFGDYRVVTHDTKVAVWTKDRQKRPFTANHRFIETKVDRDGRLLIGLPDDGHGVQVYDARTGRHLIDCGRETADTVKMEVGGPIVCVTLRDGGIRWYDLKNNSVLELPWVQTFALSGSGTWLGVVTPRGEVRVLDPATGQDAIPKPEPLAEVPIKLISFINRRPDMLVLDDEGVMGMYDLTESVTKGIPAVGQDVLDFNVKIDRLWGITGGDYAAIRFQEPENGTATVIYCHLRKGEVVSEVPNLLPYVWVDPETGNILQPARGGALLELDMHGRETKVLRALPEGEWIAFGPRGVLASSEGVGG
jgi:WD40 repeat protein